MNGNSKESNLQDIHGDKRDTDLEGMKHSQETVPKSTVVKCLTALLIVFIIISAVFMGLFVHYYTKLDSKIEVPVENRFAMTKITANTQTTSSPTQTSDQLAEKVCVTLQCVETAASIIENMDLTADPCQDFSEYACGRYNRETPIPEGYSRVIPPTTLSEAALEIVKGIVTEENQEDDPLYSVMMKNLYHSCINESQAEFAGLSAFLNETKYVNDWPTLNPDWNPATFNLSDLLATYQKEGTNPLFDYTIFSDMMDTSKNVLYITQPNLSLDRLYFNGARNNSILMAYETYLVRTAMELGADPRVAAKDAKDLVDLETEIGKITPGPEDTRIFSEMYNPFRLDKLKEAYPDLYISNTLITQFDTVGIDLTPDEKVIVFFPNYLNNLTVLLSKFDRRAIQNLFCFKNALPIVAELTEKLTEIKHEFDTIVNGISVQIPRWEYCLPYVSSVFSRGISKQYVLKVFSGEAKTYIKEMVDSLKIEFTKMLDESSWMSEHTKETARAKVSAMSYQVGYPDNDFTEEAIEKYYENYTMVPDNYQQNVRIIDQIKEKDYLLTLRQPGNKHAWVWESPPYTADALNIPALNYIQVSAAILQRPYFSLTSPDWLNYGAIGSLIGHEITHGFDDQGSHHGADGSLVDWWTPEDKEKFLNKTQCIVDQYSAFTVEEIGLNLIGQLTQGESAADLGGIKESFRAYKTLVSRKGAQPTLPGLDLTTDQLFFVAFGQMFCERSTIEGLARRVYGSVHPPGRFRIIGTLQNSWDFAKAFSCPLGSYMNPQKKCMVW